VSIVEPTDGCNQICESLTVRGTCSNCGAVKVTVNGDTQTASINFGLGTWDAGPFNFNVATLSECQNKASSKKNHIVAVGTSDSPEDPESATAEQDFWAHRDGCPSVV